jgi:hypothetical protein
MNENPDVCPMCQDSMSAVVSRESMTPEPLVNAGEFGLVHISCAIEYLFRLRDPRPCNLIGPDTGGYIDYPTSSNPQELALQVGEFFRRIGFNEMEISYALSEYMFSKDLGQSMINTIIWDQENKKITHVGCSVCLYSFDDKIKQNKRMPFLCEECSKSREGVC